MLEATFSTKMQGVKITHSAEANDIGAAIDFCNIQFVNAFRTNIPPEAVVELRESGTVTFPHNDEGEFSVTCQIVQVPEPFTPDPKNPIYLYVLLRTDAQSLVGTEDARKTGLPCAQTGHAANQMVYQARKKNIASLTAMLTEWENETGMGFGTEIVLGAHYAEIKQVVEMATLLGHHAAMTKDPEYPLWDGQTLHLIPLETCGYVFGRKNDLAPIMRRFSLMP